MAWDGVSQSVIDVYPKLFKFMERLDRNNNNNNNNNNENIGYSKVCCQ
ncbi:hypothetical protein DFA_08692 [Cavenderia fasciculata]|uniref:Uncharacterized protein n=1 Tax=Cavenderia fasciculata TaxID=261658 RepID=F4Q3U0_CACFS|nr:uncharacterized protein DFA_08692 [Cavenderia fasciculata]EGG17696.1 hypothetical protein DFA_08692 [Cavenderia fasciculata]|eukprot:XP_004356180.1 hypothetical protein DFA_08692 [Cavenderia fasciculata]